MIREWIVKTLSPKRAPVGTQPFGFPANWSSQDYLNSYGNVGWVYACVSRIAQSVGEAQFRLYKGKGKDRKEIETYPLLDVLDDCTPFHTHQEAFELCQMYLELMGEWVMLIFRDGMGIRELWPVNPQQIQVVPHPTEYIAGYVYTAPDGVTRVPLETKDVFFLKTPNPRSTYRGMGIIQSIMADVEGARYTSLWNRNYFLRGASVGGAIQVPGTLSEDAYKRLKDQWDKQHQGIANAHQTAIIEGGATWVESKIGLKDMDFGNLNNVTMKIILGAFGMPAHILGLEESTNRATAESAEYVFARWLVNPRLKRIAGKINEFLIPQFPNSKGLIGEFDNPTPEDSAFALQLAREGFQGGFMTRNESRQMVKLDSLGSVGDIFLVSIALQAQPKDEEVVNYEPMSAFGEPAEEPPEEDAPEKDAAQEIIDYLGLRPVPTIGTKITPEVRWDVFCKRLAPMENKFAVWVKDEFKQQAKETLGKMGKGQKIFGNIYAAEEYAKHMAAGSKPYLRAMLIVAAEAGAEEVGSTFDVTNPHVTEWLGKRTAVFGRGVTDTIAGQITEQLKLAHQAGESISQISARINHVFDVSVNRATMIARTEMVGSSNEGALESYRQSGVVNQKGWVSALDERTRDTHLAANGQVVDIDKDFIVGADRMQAPGQGRLAAENINCRCTVVPVMTQRQNRCVKCGKLLGKGLEGGEIECPRCKTPNQFGRETSASSTRSVTLTQ